MLGIGVRCSTRVTCNLNPAIYGGSRKPSSLYHHCIHHAVYAYYAFWEFRYDYLVHMGRRPSTPPTLLALRY